MLESRLLGNLYGRFGGGKSEKCQQRQLVGFLSCGTCVPKPLWQRFHQCSCGIGPVQRDLYSAFLAAYLDPADPIPSCAWYVVPWEGAEARLVAAHERVIQRAKEGQVLPRSMGISRLRPMTSHIPYHCGGGTAEAMRLKQRLTSARKSWGDRSMTRQRRVTPEYHGSEARQLGSLWLSLIG